MQRHGGEHKHIHTYLQVATGAEQYHRNIYTIQVTWECRFIIKFWDIFINFVVFKGSLQWRKTIIWRYVIVILTTLT